MQHQAAFHSAERTSTEIALFAGNRLGKTLCGGATVAIHATGLYPDWWEGRRWPGPTSWWVAGKTIEATRDVPQQMLCGMDLDDHLGTGMIPRHLIGKISRKQVPDAADRMYVKHVSGGWSRIGFKSFDQDETKWRGAKLHGIWFDEEPGARIYSEGIARLTDLNGIAYLTLTPLEGMTQVVALFYPEAQGEQRKLIQASIESCGLYSDEQVRKRVAAYPPHEREARARGIPLLGEGPVYPVAESSFVVAPFPVPKAWPQWLAMDFGWNHPTACVRLALDRQNDVVYVTHEYRKAEEAIIVHAHAIKAMGGDRLPVVWPKDGWIVGQQGAGQNEKSAAELYRAQQVRMWPTHATFADGGYGTETAIQAIYDRMRSGRFKVFASCGGWLEEFRMYHRKDGKLVKSRDDLQSATQKGIMMIRVARADDEDDRRKQGPVTAQSWDVFGGLARRAW